MSSVYDYQGKTDWSNCSRHVAKNLWQEKNCLRDQPDSVITNRYKITGLRSNNSILKKWTAKRQCELFFRDNNANVVTLHDACISLQCETPLKTGYYFTGPALSGIPLFADQIHCLYKLIYLFLRDSLRTWERMPPRRMQACFQ